MHTPAIWENPLGTDGFEFVEYASQEPEKLAARGVDVRDVGAVINITSQPQNRTITTGGTLTLTTAATVTDGSALTYQWKKNGTDISGATSATYTKASAVAGDAGSYTCQVSSPTAGTVIDGRATEHATADPG